MDPTRFLTPAFWHSEETITLEGKGIPQPTLPLPPLPTGTILFGSSGSSGVHKWIVHTRDSLLASAQAVNAHLSVTPEDRFGLLLPSFHVGGFGILARAYQTGCPCAFYTDRWGAQQAYHFLSEQQVTITSLVPTQVYDLVDTGLTAPPHMRAIIVGGGRLAPEIGQRALDLGWPVLQSYGMSEAASQIATAPLSALSLPFDSQPLQVLPHWSLSTAPDDRLIISGPALCAGILSQEADTLSFTPVGGSFCTNDRAELIGDTLSFLGRVDRTVKVKGELVNLDALERTLSTVQQTMVVLIPVPDEREEHRIHAFATSPLDQLSDLLPPFLQLAHIHQLDQFPTSALGKLDRRALSRYCSEQ